MKQPKKQQFSLFPGPVSGDIPYPIHINYDDGQGWKPCDVHRAMNVLALFYPANRINDLLSTGRPLAVVAGGRSVYFARPRVGVDLPTTFWTSGIASGAERPQRSEDAPQAAGDTMAAFVRRVA